MVGDSSKILIYRLGSLGDTIIALPCFHKIKACFPHADITLLTNRPVASKAAPSEVILGNGYFFDRVINYPIGTRNLYVLGNLLKQIRSYKIDTVINLAAARSKISTTRDHYFFKAAGITKQIGFPKVKEDFETSIDPETGEYEWEAKRLTRRIEILGDISLNEGQYWDLRLTNEELNLADQFIGGINKPIIAISFGTKMQANDWGEDNWLALLTRLKVLLPNWMLIVVGAAEETNTANRRIEAWHSSALNLCGQTSPRVSAAILHKAKVFVGHDSGPMHLAACVGTPCVAVFSARNLPGQWYPRGNSNQILYHQTDCAGCGLEICIDQKKKCILSITVDEVQQAVLKTISSSQI